MDLRLHVVLYPVTGTPLNLRTLRQQLIGVDERQVLDDLEQARSNITTLLDEPELLPLLALLSEQEGPGVLVTLHIAEEPMRCIHPAGGVATCSFSAESSDQAGRPGSAQLTFMIASVR